MCGGLVFWVFRSTTTDPPPSSFGRVLGATGTGVGVLLAMKFILSSGLPRCSHKVNWRRNRHIQATGGRNRPPFCAGPARAVAAERPEGIETLVCEILTSPPSITD